MRDKNIFGGGNPNSLYVPMSELEQEAVSRLVESKDLRVMVVGWGYVDKPRVTFGDARLQIQFRLSFDKPEAPMSVPYFDLELRVGSTGALLFKDRKSTAYGGNAIQVAAGVFLDLVWDIQVRSIDPALVKSLVPGATGLTSRLVDKDTGEMTEVGNMKLTSKERRVLRTLRAGEDRVRKTT